jgi:hypothetical protein
MPDDCIISGKWPERDRRALREMIETLLLHWDKFRDERPVNLRLRLFQLPLRQSVQRGTHSSLFVEVRRRPHLQNISMG